MFHSTTTNTLLVPIAMVGIFPLSLLLFGMLKPRRAALAVTLIGWLFLPQVVYIASSFPEITKASAITWSVFLGVVVFDFQRILSFRPRWFDLPMALLPVGAVITSLVNGLGIYDGFSAMYIDLQEWGIRYFVGRLYFSNLRGAKELAYALVIGGLVYVPFCFWEIRMAPTLHHDIYGFSPHSFLQQIRFGGYRPMVFMRHGLQVALWMATTSVCAFGLWQLMGVREIKSVPMWAIFVVLAATTILCKTVGAVFIMTVGVGIITAVKVSRSYWPVIAAACIPIVYVLLRGPGIWQGHELVTLVDTLIGSRRAASLETRIVNENMLTSHGLQRPIFGWGRWGRNRIESPAGRDITTTDGRWVILLSSRGLWGMCGFMAVILAPPFLARYRFRDAFLATPRAGPLVLLNAMLALWMIHNIPNTSSDPFFLMMAGGVIAITRAQTVRRRVVRVASQGSATSSRPAVQPAHSRGFTR